MFQESSATSRNVEVTFPGFAQYTGNLIINEGLFCSDTAPMIINLFPAIFSEFEFEFDTCVAGPVDFEDLSTTGATEITDWDWSFDGEGTSAEMDPSFEFMFPGDKLVTLEVTDNNGCQTSRGRTIRYFPVPETIIIEPSQFIGCAPATVFLENNSFPIDSTYDFSWDLGDGNTSSDLDVTHTYLEPGLFSISLDIVSPLGCEVSRGFLDWISILDSPEAAFTCDPMEANILDKTINFTDQSFDSGAWQWDFGGAGSSFLQNPTFTFPDTGIYRVRLTTFHPVTNCPDTTSKLIDVVPLADFHFPNAFTPNNDASNDIFMGNGIFGGVVDYTLTIYNRWGQLVYESTDPRQGWNGKEFNVGSDSPQGVYVYKARYRDPRGNLFNTDGHITLLR